MKKNKLTCTFYVLILLEIFLLSSLNANFSDLLNIHRTYDFIAMYFLLPWMAFAFYFSLEDVFYPENLKPWANELASSTLLLCPILTLLFFMNEGLKKPIEKI